MNEMKIFNNTEFGEMGVLVIEGKEYFPATECARVL
jgi:prophage antirepressor-like protein